MQKKVFGMSIIILAVGLVIGSLAVAEISSPGPEPAALWKYITKTSPYTKWGF